jgi:hypothetical protein
MAFERGAAPGSPRSARLLIHPLTLSQRRSRAQSRGQAEAHKDGVESGASMVGNANNGFDSARRVAARGRLASLLTPLVVIALFLCHGTAGGLHEAALEPAPSAAAHSLGAQAPGAGHPGWHAPRDVDQLAYVAAFFAALLVTLLRPSFAIYERTSAAPSLTPLVAFVTPVPCCGLAPTPPTLQVFRL